MCPGRSYKMLILNRSACSSHAPDSNILELLRSGLRLFRLPGSESNANHQLMRSALVCWGRRGGTSHNSHQIMSRLMNNNLDKRFFYFFEWSCIDANISSFVLVLLLKNLPPFSLVCTYKQFSNWRSRSTCFWIKSVSNHGPMNLWFSKTPLLWSLSGSCYCNCAEGNPSPPKKKDCLIQPLSVN